MTMFLRNDIYVDLEAVTEVTTHGINGHVRIEDEDGIRSAAVSLNTALDLLAALKARNEQEEQSKLRAVG